MWSAKVIDDQCWLISPEGEKIAEFTNDAEIGRVVALLNVNMKPHENDRDRLLAFMRERMAAENKLPKDMQRKIASERLVSEGIYRIGSNGDLILHENYGGPPLGE